MQRAVCVVGQRLSLPSRLIGPRPSAQPARRLQSFPAISGTMVKIAMGQMCATNDAETNFAVVEGLVKQASDAGAELVSLPECFEFMGTNAGESQAFATTLADKLFQK